MIRSYASVGGGRSNTASDYYASVSGGYGNEADDWYASVSGGRDNRAVGDFASVSGGIYFHEFDKFEGRHVPPYIVGNVFMFGGIAMLTPNDIFIVKYTADGQPGLDRHRDGSFVSFNLALSNSRGDYEGGGTRVWDAGEVEAKGKGSEEEAGPVLFLRHAKYVVSLNSRLSSVLRRSPPMRSAYFTSS